MRISKSEVENYLSEIKVQIRKDHYRIDRNPKRQSNIDCFTDYLLSESDAKIILLSLCADDFSEIRDNTHPGYEYEKLYVFGKTVRLTERFGNRQKDVSLYIKINKRADDFVIVISFHEQKFPLRYYFGKS